MVKMVSEELIVKYLAGEAEPHEIRMISEWREQLPENEKTFQLLSRLWNASGNLKENDTFNTDRAWEKVESKIDRNVKGRVIPIRRYWMAAAAIALLFVLSFLMFRQGGEQQEMLSSVAGPSPALVMLSDSSEMTVRSGEVSYPRTFGDKTRTVLLKKGTSYFKVRKNEELPFEVLAGDVAVTVLGTEFEVSHEPDKTSVKVRSGKVMFSTPGGRILLTAGNSASYHTGSRQLVSERQAEVNDFAYATGILEFKGQTLPDVAKQLSAYYGISIVPDPALKNCRLTATFDKEKLENVLEVLRVTLEAQVSRDSAGNIFISGERSCQP